MKNVEIEVPTQLKMHKTMWDKYQAGQRVVDIAREYDMDKVAVYKRMHRWIDWMDNPDPDKLKVGSWRTWSAEEKEIRRNEDWVHHRAGSTASDETLERMRQAKINSRMRREEIAGE